MIQLHQKLVGHSDRIWTLAWNPTGSILASSGGDKSIRLWAKKGDQWECISILTESHSKSIRRLCWSPCGQYLASASFDATVCIWKRNPLDGSWTTAVNLEGHESEVKSVAWSSDGNYLASCGRDKSIWIWERATADEDQEVEDDIELWDCSDVKNDHSKDVKHVVWHPNHNILASCSYDDSIKLFNKADEDWKCFQTLASHESTVWSADFSSSGEFLASCSDDKTVRVWKNHSHAKLPNVETNSWKCVSVIQGYHTRTIYDISWCKSKDLIVSASGDNSLVIYGPSVMDPTNLDTFVCLNKHSLAHDCDVNSVAWNPADSSVLATASDDRHIKIWSYNPENKGMKPLKVVDEIIQSLLSASVTDSHLSNEAQVYDCTINVTDHSQLSQTTQNLQILQDELSGDDNDKRLLEKLFDLKICDHSKPLRLSHVLFDANENLTTEFSVEISGPSGDILHRFRLLFGSCDKFKLRMPRRSVNLLAIAGELFLFEKTGDLYKILPSGECTFLLGHLFTFADVKFILADSESLRSQISYIVSADRDEKIRISKYPKTFEIERFCFGHKNLIRKLHLVEDSKFISVDQENNAYLWSIQDIMASSEPLRPIRSLALVGEASKRICLGKNSRVEESARN